MNKLTMVFYSGAFFIGKVVDRKMFEPRLYNLIQVAANEVQHRLNLLPSSPAFVSLPRETMYWPVADKDIEALYIKATTGIVTAKPDLKLVQ